MAVYDAVGAAASPQRACSPLYSHELYAMFYTAHKFPWEAGRGVGRGGGGRGAERRFPGTRRLYSLPGWIQRPGLELIGPASSWLEMLSGRLRSHQRSPSVSWLRVCVLPLLYPFLYPVRNAYSLPSNCRSFSLSLSLSLSSSQIPTYLFRFFVFLSTMLDMLHFPRRMLLHCCWLWVKLYRARTTWEWKIGQSSARC